MEIKEYKVGNIEELFAKLMHYSSDWVFRGQRDSTWKLTRSIERPLIDTGFDNSLIASHETFVRLRFESSAYHFLSPEPVPQSEFSWLALMQHYGAPTRLVDFTTMPFIALFFAFDGVNLNNINNDSCVSVWCLPYKEINAISKNMLCRGRKDDEVGRITTLLKEKFDEFYDSYASDSSSNLFWILEPKNLNLRLRQQGGTFLICNNFEKPLYEIIEEDKIYNLTIDKINIPVRLIVDVYAMLNKMHINNMQIYPGLEGLTKDIQLNLLHLIKSTKS